jgi:diguanylate cyclase (GGDEF)-like protein
MPAGRLEEGMTTSPTEGSEARLSALAAAAGLLARGGDLDETLRSILAVAAEATGAELGAVFIAHPDRPDLHLAAAYGLPDEALPGFAAEVVENPDHPIARAVATGSASIGREGIRPGGTATVGADAPLVVARDGIDVTLGVCSLGWRAPHPIDDGERRFLLALADLIAVGVDRAIASSLASERSEWFERLAHTDALTGLANSRTLARVLELELARASRQGGEVSVAVFDVDQFGSLNEQRGREAGDDALRHVAVALAESVRFVDTVARTGADEFVLVAPGSAGVTVARRVLGRVAGIQPVDGMTVSASAGVARFPADGTSADDLMAAARAALQEAKATGAGTLVEATPQPTA